MSCFSRSWHYQEGWPCTACCLVQLGGEWPWRCDFYCDGRSIPPALPERTVYPGQSCPAANWWHFQLLFYCKCTQSNVMTEITHDREGGWALGSSLWLQLPGDIVLLRPHATLSTAGLVQIYNNDIMERPDQGHLHPKLEVPGLTCPEFPPPRWEASTLAKSYSNSVIIAIWNICISFMRYKLALHVYVLCVEYPVRPKTRGLVQHAGPPCLPFPYRISCPDESCPAVSWWNFQLLLYIVNEHNHPSWATSCKEGMAWYSSIDPCLLSESTSKNIYTVSRHIPAPLQRVNCFPIFSNTAKCKYPSPSPLRILDELRENRVRDSPTAG